MPAFMPTPKQQYFGIASIPLIGGKIFTYAAGTSTPKATFTDFAGTIPQPNPITLNTRGEPPNAIFWSGSYRVVIQDALGNVIYSVDNYQTPLMAGDLSGVGGANLLGFDYSAVYSVGTVGRWLQNLATNVGSTFIGFIQDAVGAVLRTLESKGRDSVSVKDFGAVGDDVADDTVAILAAMAHAKLKKRSVYFPSGIYRYTSTINIPYGVRVYGESEYTTVLRYLGAGDGVYMGGPGNTTIISYCMLDDVTVYCMNRATTVNGVNLDNCCYFSINRVSVFGSGSPNSATPADRVLYGSGIQLSNNSIIGTLNKVTCRLWARGRYYWTRPGSESFWTAAIVDGGQGEISNNMVAIQIGDPTVPFASAVGVTFRDLCLQGNYQAGIDCMSGESTTFDSLYFEGNANYDIRFGGGAANPVMNRLINCTMSAADIGVTPYGNFPYLYKVHVLKGSFTQIHANNLSIGTAIPLISIGVAAEATNYSKNRLNSTAAVSARVLDQSASTISSDNNPEKPRYATGTITRSLSAPDLVVNYGGLGFMPTEIEFYANIDTTNEFSEGAAGIGMGLVQQGVATDATGAKFSSGYPIRIIRSGAGNEQRAMVSGFTNDGFSLLWTKIGAPPANTMVVTYIARR